jgi:hypothetical protein
MNINGRQYCQVTAWNFKKGMVPTPLMVLKRTRGGAAGAAAGAGGRL